MLTIFALPKPFQGQINVIQRNALCSWLMLRPSCQIILFGDENGTAAVARELGLIHVKEVAKNEFGTPLLNDSFERAQRLAEHDIVCYVNSDIILLKEFTLAVEEVKQGSMNFLAIGECWNLDIVNPVDFGRSDWDEHLRGLVNQNGTPRGPWALDYFVFPRGFYENVPPFAMGRAYFDNWLVWKAIAQKAQVVDLTDSTTVIHQNHHYDHVCGGQQWVYRGAEAIRNTNLGGGISRRYCILDATHYLDHSGLKRNFLNKLNWSMLKIWRKRIWYLILDSTRPLRHSLGVRTDGFQRFKAFLHWKRKDV